jgi:hypothetical protein
MIRAFFLALRALEFMEQRKQKKLIQGNDKYNNAGRPWSSEEDALLTEAFKQKTPLAELVRQHGRTKGALASRLVRLGIITERAELTYSSSYASGKK